MENEKRMKRENGETPLPEAMIQHIQSFMSGKEAAQTTLVSKSWYGAWLTRPSLDLDDRYFCIKSSLKLSEFAMKAMQRYQDSNLKIDSFRLRIRMKKEEDTHHYRWAHKLIVSAMKIGANDVQLELPYSFTLPQEVLGSQTLLKLSLTNCKVDKKNVIRCSRLKSLTLKNVEFTSGDDDVLKDILRCNSLSLEELSVEFPAYYSSSRFLILPESLLRLSLRGRVGVKSVISCSNLKSLSLCYVTFTNIDVFKDIITCCISMEELSLCSCNALREANIIMYEFGKLRRLFLSDLSLDTIFFTDFASRFPCLEDLTIHHCRECTKIQIASTSLRRISFTAVKAEFDVPNIRKFTYLGWCLPSRKLYIKATYSWGWEFDISISSTQFYKRSWFLQLKRYLTKYRLSRISLSINLNSFIKDPGDEDDAFFVVPKHPLVVENLMIDAPSSYCSFV